MSDGASIKRTDMTRAMVWIGVALVLLIVLGANVHLVYVAVRSQPACVAHLRQGESGRDRDDFSAAQSACSPSEGAAQRQRLE